MGRLIDADELIKDDEVNLWLSNDAVRTGKTLKMFSELFIKKIKSATPVEAIPKDQYEARLRADMVAMLEDLDLQIDESGSYNLEVAKVQRLIRDRIAKLKE